jgi:gluconolactonase
MRRIVTTLLLLSTAISIQAQGVTPNIKDVVSAGTSIELVKEGFQGTEGPIALPDGSTIFTETQANRITRIAADGSTSAFLEDTNGANGLAFNKSGELVAVIAGKPSIAVLYPKDKARVLVDSYQGRPLGRPNDLVVDKHGGVYFTDPGPNAPAGQPVPTTLPATAVYYLSSAGELHLLDTTVPRPNGVKLSPDEKTLYVNNTWGEYVLAYDIKKDGTVGARRDFAKLQGFRKTETGTSSGADGLAVDARGNVYVATTDGVQVFTGEGEALGVIALPKAPQNLAFAGPGKKVLYIVGRGSAWRIDTQTSGYTGRAK